MPRDNERISSNLETVVNRGACRLSRRSQNRNNYRLSSKEQSLPIPDLRNSEQRCTVLFVALDHDSWKILVPICVFHQVSEERNQLDSKVDTSLNCVESLEQRNSSPECPGSAELSTASSSSETSVLGKSTNRRKWTKSDKDFSVNSTPQMKKPVKKSSRKNGKKKRKQFKGSAQKNTLVISQYKEGISQDLLVQDKEEDNSAEPSNHCGSSSARALALTLYNSETHKSEQVSSLYRESSGKNFSFAHSGRFESLSDSTSSCSTISSVILSTSSEGTSNSHLKQDAICETSRISPASEPNSSMDELETITFDNFSDIENCGKISETSSSMGSSEWLKYDVDADNTNERVQCSSEASTGDGFHPVVYKKRGRLARKAYFSSNSLYGQKTRNQAERCIRGSKNDNNFQHVDISSKGSEESERLDKVEERKQNANGALCIWPCSDEKVVETAVMDPLPTSSSDVDPIDLSKVINERLLHNSPKKLQKEPNSASNKDCLENQNIQSQEIAEEITAQNLKKIGSQSSSQCTVEFRNPDTDIFELCQSESPQNKQMDTFQEQNEHSNVGILDSEDTQRMELESDNWKDLLQFDKFSSKVLNMMDLISDRLQPSKVNLKLPISKFHHLVPSNKDDGFASFDTDLYQIIQAVDESYNLLTASESIGLETGSPLAEFERFLHSASPTISQTIGDAFCTHQVPKDTLGSLWQWYEKPGSYGLEVKVEDYYNKNGCCNRSQFRAYFVPYLSAVQLFARGDIRDRVSKEFNTEGRTSNSSYSLESLPIFSKLLPRPRKKINPSDKDEVNCKNINSYDVTDQELIFEYFEADQPQQRRPLFEKIKELARGEISSNCPMFGDPSILECLNFHDLHPASWFSVAWYPIYRIPDGNLHAAFLTYHSLGRFLHRGMSSNMIGDVNQIVSPAVGMHTYNAKGECWFAERGFMAEKTMSTNTSEILNKRLQTLETAASVMARATIRKGNQKSVNKHPDYEFFLSRKR